MKPTLSINLAVYNNHSKAIHTGNLKTKCSICRNLLLLLNIEYAKLRPEHASRKGSVQEQEENP